MDIGSVSTEQLLEQFKATLQLSQSVATAWYDGATLDCAIAYNNVLLHQRDQATEPGKYVTYIYIYIYIICILILKIKILECYVNTCDLNVPIHQC